MARPLCLHKPCLHLMRRFVMTFRHPKLDKRTRPGESRNTRRQLKCISAGVCASHFKGDNRKGSPCVHSAECPWSSVQFLDCVWICVDCKQLQLQQKRGWANVLEMSAAVWLDAQHGRPQKQKAAIRIREDLTDALFLTVKVGQSNRGSAGHPVRMGENL